MPHHNFSLTCVAASDISLYGVVKIVEPGVGTDSYGLPMVEMCSETLTDIVFGVAFEAVSAGEFVTVHLPFGGLLPAYCYTQPKPGQGLTIGHLYPGSLSNNLNPLYARRVAYVVEVGPSIGFSSDISWCMVAFTRAYVD